MLFEDALHGGGTDLVAEQLELTGDAPASPDRGGWSAGPSIGLGPVPGDSLSA